MSKVAPEEPEGYRGRRRHFRFPFARKAGGAAVPALLVAASIVVVLIVVGVSQLLPKQAAGMIPFGSAPGNVSDDNNGQPQPTGPDGSLLPTPGKSGKPSKSASGKPSSPGSTVGPVPTETSTPTATPTPPATFAPLLVQAESAALAGGAYSSTSGCSSCMGGAKVRNVGKTSSTVNGTVTVSVTAPADGNYKITISFELSGTRDLWLQVNGGTGKDLALSGTSWGVPANTSATVALKSGSNSIRFYNSTAAAPDLDAVKIEQA